MQLKAFVPGIVWFIISVVLLALPGNNLPQNNLFDFPFLDKVVHLVMFFLLSSLFCFPFVTAAFKKEDLKKLFNKIGLGVIFYGIVMEFIQKYFVTNRSFEVVDIAFDTLGSIVGIMVVRRYSQKK